MYQEFANFRVLTTFFRKRDFSPTNKDDIVRLKTRALERDGERQRDREAKRERQRQEEEAATALRREWGEKKTKRERDAQYY